MTPPAPIKRARRGREGFSLIEVLIASALLSTSVCWSALLTVKSRELASQAQETNVAVGILEAQMAECLTFDRFDLTGGEEAFVPGTELVFEEFFEDQVLQYDTPNWAVGEVVPNVLEIQLTLSWTSSNSRTRTLELRGRTR